MLKASKHEARPKIRFPNSLLVSDRSLVGASVKLVPAGAMSDERRV